MSASAAGTATIAIRYANGTTANRPADVLVNGITVLSMSFESASGWNSWTTKPQPCN